LTDTAVSLADPIQPDTSERVKPLPPHLQKLVDLLPLNQWVHRSVLESEYGKSNVMRRIRKIRSEYGWDVRSERRSAGANDDWYMRCSSEPTSPQRIRKEVKKSDRQKIYDRDIWRCQMCGCDVGIHQNQTMPQCDHKVPAERGGHTELNNLQTLCIPCNLKKRQACKHCTLPSCVGCPYAFPEEFANTLVLKLSDSAGRRLQKLARDQGLPPATVVERMIESTS
jgi:hypothetical protein